MIQPNTIVGLKLPEARPLRVICSFLGPFAQQLVEKVSGVVPEVFWQRKVLSYASQIQGIMMMVGLLSQPTAEWLLHMLEEGRGLCIPALTLLTPGVLTSYGVVYVQFLLPMARSYNKQRSIDATLLWLQYWVLHAGVDSVLSYFSSILWWIPFSTHATFCLWCYLSLPRTIKNWYDVLESEFKLLGLLPGNHEGDFDGTRTARLLNWIWEILPKARDENQDHDKETNENKSNKRPNIDTVTGESEDQLSPVLPLGRQLEECKTPSPKILISVDTCTTSEDGDEDCEPDCTDEDCVMSCDDDEGVRDKSDDDKGVRDKSNDDKSDDSSDVAVVDLTFEDEKPRRRQLTEPPRSHSMMTRSARRRLEKSSKYRQYEVVRD